MTRCQHCKKLTHSEDLYVEYNVEDQGKIMELSSLIGWTPFYQYAGISNSPTPEYGRLKCGDIYIHFLVKRKD